MTYDPTTPSWKQKPTTDRQTDRQGLGKRMCLTQFSPLCSHSKRKSNTGYAAPPPTPPIAAFVGPPSARGGPKAASYRSSFTLVCSWQLRALFLPSASSSVIPRPLSPTRTFSVLSGPPCTRASGEAATLASSLLPARARPDPLCPVCGTHTAAPLSLRSGAERCRLIRGGVVYGG